MTLGDLMSGVVVSAVWLVLAAALFVVPSWFLWNWLMPEIFGLPEIGFIECFGMLLLARMLFGKTLKVNFGTD